MDTCTVHEIDSSEIFIKLRYFDIIFQKIYRYDSIFSSKSFLIREMELNCVGCEEIVIFLVCRLPQLFGVYFWDKVFRDKILVRVSIFLFLGSSFEVHYGMSDIVNSQISTAFSCY